MEEEDDALAALFLDENYVMQSFVIGPYSIPALSLKSSSTDYDLTGQILWPGTDLLNGYVLRNSTDFRGASVIELGSGIGLTGLLCDRIGCSKVVMTDHSDTVLKIMRRNVELQSAPSLSLISCEKLEWGNEDHLAQILEKHPEGFDFIVGADICYQQASLGPLLRTVKHLLSLEGKQPCKFILGYISRIHSTDLAFIKRVSEHKLVLREVSDSTTRSADGIHNGVIYEITT